MIDNELTQSTIAKTLQKFTDKFNSMDNFKTVRNIIIINDSALNDAKNALPNAEVYGLEIFQNGLAGILAEVEKESGTLWLFNFLGVSHEAYNEDFYQALLPLCENEQTLMFFLAYRPYHLFCDGSPLRHAISMCEGVPVLDDCEYGISAHFNSLTTATPTVITSDSFDKLVELYTSEDQVDLDLDIIRLATLTEHCYVSSLYHIESDHEMPLADYATFEMMNKIVQNSQPAVLRTQTTEHGQLVYNILNAAMTRNDFNKVKLGIALYDPSGIKVSDKSRQVTGQSAQWSPEKLSDFSNLPFLVVYAGAINEFMLHDYPLFSTIDMRLIMNGYFTRLDFEREFLLATSYNKKRTSRTSAEWQAIQALQGLGKRKVEEMEEDGSQAKKIKVEHDSDDFSEKSYSPTKVILSKEAFSLFKDNAGDLNYTGIVPAKHCEWIQNRQFSLNRLNTPSELVDYYGKNCKSLLGYGNGLGATSRRFVVSMSHCVKQTIVVTEIAREIEHRIRSQFTVDVLDESEIDIHTTQPNLSLTKSDQLYYSSIINSIPDAHLAAYTEQRQNYRAQEPKSFNVELSNLSIVPSRTRRKSDSPHAVWPLSLNIPQLSEGNTQGIQVSKNCK